ncbi:hypothetical protein EYZ11_013440 [Aspergillus tanneri]|uniref:C2H2-type domain-containing protein n=1 Tax=Aspergillus tanneri TaxID=1220188 RepID=A0A4V3UMF2_9EURO|nr:hypothetical protein EYZ11_013440 [Aspergillus tanneri]
MEPGAPSIFSPPRCTTRAPHHPRASRTRITVTDAPEQNNFPFLQRTSSISGGMQRFRKHIPQASRTTPPTRISTHPSAATPALRQAALTEMLQRPWLDPAREPYVFPLSNSPAVPGLPVYSGYSCLVCSHILRTKESLRVHMSRRHPETRQPRGRRPANRPPVPDPTRHPVSCQRFFIAGPGCRFFPILPPSQTERARQAATMTTADFIRAQVDQALERVQAADNVANQHVPADKHATEVSPWLELTQWPRYLQGHDFAAVAALGALPDAASEPLLVLFTQSVEQLIHRAYATIADRRVNEFDQIRINTFLQRPAIWDRPIQIYLTPATYRRYIRIWQRLICFAYRTSRPDQTIMLRHQPTTTQLAAMDRMHECGAQLQRDRDSAKGQAELDSACLALSIALLNHPLKGDLFESTVIGFLAALGVDPVKRTFHEPYGYTSYLSGLVKMAQMLVVERAVQMADDGTVAHPADALDNMRERFLLHGVRAPFGWITRRRTYGKKVQNTTTSLGYIYWSDDEQTLSYRKLRLTMAGLRRFVRTEISLAQAALEQLFLLHEEESRAAVVPTLALHKLQDDPVNNQRGWNFLQDRRNRAVLPTTGERWLLDRVLAADWLREEFVQVRATDAEVVWKVPAVDRYLRQVDEFLQRLLVLIHITAGQPGRATEIVSLRHSNTVHGRHRNIFIEHGLVSTVTAYHKGYSVSNSTKIIHRYLPKPVSELVVYYLWLILPFWQSIQQLAHQETAPRSPFLWARGDQCWDASRLRIVLEREAQKHLQTKINVLSYRHAAIAISRVHLKCGGFKRDYGTDDPAFSQQASHGSWVAGTVYARGLQEAPGHVEARRRRYRAISREWHGFLGFETYLGPRKRPAEGEEDNYKGRKRLREYITVEMD